MHEPFTHPSSATLNAQIDQQEAELKTAQRRFTTSFIIAIAYTTVMVIAFWLRGQQPSFLTDLANAFPIWQLVGVHLLCGAYFFFCLRRSEKAAELLHESQSLKRQLTSGTN